MTLAQFCALLALSHGSAVDRVPRPTIDRLGCRYLTRSIWLVEKDGSPDGVPINHAGLSLALERWPDRSLDLTDPGTVNGIRTALALARGADPAEGVIWKRWSSEEWALETSSLRQHFRIHEPDPIRALVLAVEHVLSASEDL